MSDSITDPQQVDPRNTRQAVMAAIAIGLAFIAVVVAVGLFAGVGRDSFSAGSVAQLKNALRAHGLDVCETTVSDDTGYAKGGAISTQVLSVALPNDCSNSIDVQVDTYRNASDRDGAAMNAEAQEKQRNYGVVYTWHHFTVYLQADDASGSTDVRNRVVDALESVGAN